MLIRHRQRDPPRLALLPDGDILRHTTWAMKDAKVAARRAKRSPGDPEVPHINQAFILARPQSISELFDTMECILGVS